MPDTPTATDPLRDSALSLVMALSDPALDARDAAWQGTLTALVLWDIDPARARKLIERLRVIAAGAP